MIETKNGYTRVSLVTSTPEGEAKFLATVHLAYEYSNEYFPDPTFTPVCGVGQRLTAKGAHEWTVDIRPDDPITCKACLRGAAGGSR